MKQGAVATGRRCPSGPRRDASHISLVLHLIHTLLYSSLGTCVVYLTYPTMYLLKYTSFIIHTHDAYYIK